MSRDKPLHVLSAIPLEPAHREKITGADPRILLHYPEDLMPARRYEGDKVGHPMEWTDDMEARWRKLLREAEVLFGFDRRNLANLPTLAPNLRWIQGSSTGIGGVVSAHGWADHNIITTSARGIHAEPLGEFHAFAILAFAKDLPRMQEQKANHHFQRYCTGRVRGKTLGVIGLGKNGKAVVRMGRALGISPSSVTNMPTLISLISFQIFCLCSGLDIVAALLESVCVTFTSINLHVQLLA